MLQNTSTYMIALIFKTAPGVWYVYLHFTDEAQRGEASCRAEEWQGPSQVPGLRKARCLWQRGAGKMEITLGRWIPTSVEGVRAEELTDEKAQVGVLSRQACQARSCTSLWPDLLP